MAQLSVDIKNAAVKCLTSDIDFCLYAFPGQEAEEAFFYSNPSNVVNKSVTNGKVFFIGSWKEKSENFVRISEAFDATETLKLKDVKRHRTQVKCVRPTVSTSKEEYVGALAELIDTIKSERLEKVVLSRVRCGERNGSMDFYIGLTERIFNLFPNSFRFLFGTAKTGVWMGATPELLVDIDKGGKSLCSMALAGTRLAKNHNPDDVWPKKDLDEQRIVNRYLIEKLEGAGFNVNEAVTGTMTIGQLQHICTDIKCSHKNDKEEIDGYRAIDLLNPSPAVSGSPQERAFELIDKLEKHRRNCYCGVVGVEDANGIHAYVNLRSMQFDENGYCLYAGGGVLASSDVESEWLETENKLDNIGYLI